MTMDVLQNKHASWANMLTLVPAFNPSVCFGLSKVTACWYNKVFLEGPTVGSTVGPPSVCKR